MEEYYENRDTFMRKAEDGFVIDLMEDGQLVRTVKLNKISDAERISDDWMFGKTNVK